MAHNNKQTKSTDEVNVQMRRSFSWDRAFFTSDGVLDADELSSMIEGDGDDVKQQLQKIEEIESMETKLFQEIETSTEKSGKKNSKAKKIKAAPNASSSSSTPIKTVQSTRSAPLSGGSIGSQRNKVKSPARRSTVSKTGKAAVDSPSKTKNKVASRVSRTSPASPVSSGPSSSAAFSVNQRSKRSSSVPRRSTVSNEKPSAVDARRNDEWKASKPAVKLIPKTQSSISLKNKPPPVVSHPSPGLINASSSSTDQKSKPMGKSALKNRSTSSSSASRPGTRSPNGSQTRKLLAPKAVAAVNTGMKPKPTSQKTTTPKKASKKQSSGRAKSTSSGSRGAENIILVSPEVMDIKGKLNALKMEINMQKQKNDKCMETKMSHDKSGKGESRSIKQMKNRTKPI